MFLRVRNALSYCKFQHHCHWFFYLRTAWTYYDSILSNTSCTPSSKPHSPLSSYLPILTSKCQIANSILQEAPDFKDSLQSKFHSPVARESLSFLSATNMITKQGSWLLPVSVWYFAQSLVVIFILRCSRIHSKMAQVKFQYL